MKTILRTALTVSLLFAAAQSQAAIMTFTDRGLWEAAAGSFLDEDFTGDDGSFDGATLNVGDFSLTGDSTGGFSDMTISGGVVNANTCGAPVCGFDFGYVLTFDFPVFGFGADYVSANDGAGIDFLADAMAVAGPSANDGFFGFLSDTAFTTLTVFGGDEVHSFDDAVYAIAQVPAPTTILLIGAGLIGLGITKRKAS